MGSVSALSAGAYPCNFVRDGKHTERRCMDVWTLWLAPELLKGGHQSGHKGVQQTRKSKMDYKGRSEVVHNGRSKIFHLPEVGTSSGQEEVSSSCGHQRLTLEIGTGRGHTGGGQEVCRIGGETRVNVWVEYPRWALDGVTRGGHLWYSSLQNPDVGYRTITRCEQVSGGMQRWALVMCTSSMGYTSGGHCEHLPCWEERPSPTSWLFFQGASAGICTWRWAYSNMLTVQYCTIIKKWKDKSLAFLLALDLTKLYKCIYFLLGKKLT